MTDKQIEAKACDHRGPRNLKYDHIECALCGQILTDSGWGIASGLWFKDLQHAHFYRQHGRMLDAPAAPTEGARDASAQQDERQCTCGSGPGGGHSRTCLMFDESMMRYDPFGLAAQQDEREAFEAWLHPCWTRDKYMDPEGDLIYRETWVQGAWIAWQARKQQVQADAAVRPDPLLAECVEALEALLGPDNDPNIGWFGNAKTSRNHFRCEHCGAEDVDCSKIPHALACRVVKARAILAKVQAAKEGKS